MRRVTTISAVLLIAIALTGCMESSPDPIRSNPWDADSPYPPRSPIDLTATLANAGEVVLEWTDMSGNEEGFQIEQSYDGNQNYDLIRNTSASDTTETISNLLPNSLYYFRVCGVNRFGASLFTNEISVQTPQIIPAAPTALGAFTRSASRIDLAWQDNSINEDSFNVYRVEMPDTVWQAVASLPANTSIWSDMSLASRTTYSYRVKAVNDSGSSAYSNIETAATFDIAPSAPTGLQAGALSSSRIRLRWSDNSNNEDGFALERRLGIAGNWVSLDSAGFDNSVYLDTTLLVDTVYFYRVHAYNAVGRSGNSNEAMISTSRTPPEPPTNLEAVAVSPELIDLSWQDRSSNETGFGIERRIGAQGVWELAADVESNSVFHRLTGNQPGTGYQLRVRAYNSFGESEFTNTVTIQMPDRLPAAPSNLVASAVSPHQIDLTWNDNSDNEDWFEVMRHSEGNQDWQLIGRAGAGVTSHSDLSLQTNSEYTYRVTAVNENGTSDFSNEASIRTQAERPGAPSNLQAETDAERNVILTWSDNSESEDGFVLERKEAEGEFEVLDSLDLNAVSMTDTTTSSSSSYTYRLFSFNSAGNSEYSNEAEVRPEFVGVAALVCTGAQGLWAIDVTDPENPALLGRSSEAERIRLKGEIAFIHSNYGIYVTDISDLKNQQLVGFYRTDFSDMVVEGDYLYILTHNRLQIVSIATPVLPSLVGEYNNDANVWNSPKGISVSGGHGYISTSNRGLWVMNIENPASPTYVAQRNDFGTNINSVFAIGQYAYITTSDSGFRSLDISDPANPRVTGDCNRILRGQNEIIVKDDFAYVITGESGVGRDGLRVISISNPASPHEVGFLDLGDFEMSRFDIYGDYAFVIGSQIGLRCIDISNPINPVEVGRFDLPANCSDIKVIEYR